MPSPPQLSEPLSLHQWLPYDASFGYAHPSDPLYVGIDHPDIFASTTPGPSQETLEHENQTGINSVHAPDKNGLRDSVGRDNVQPEAITGEQDVHINVENEIRLENEGDGNCGETASFAAKVDTMLQGLNDTAHRRTVTPHMGIRVNIEQTAEIDNPLERDGHNAVIRCRLRPDRSYTRAANTLGLRLVLQQYAPQSVSSASDCSPRDRRRLFLLDCNAVHRSIKRHDIKVPIIGGGPLDLFQLQRGVFIAWRTTKHCRKACFQDCGSAT